MENARESKAALLGNACERSRPGIVRAYRARAPSSMNLEILLSVDRNAPRIYRRFIYAPAGFVLPEAGTTGRFCSYAIHRRHLSSVLSSRAKTRESPVDMN